MTKDNKILRRGAIRCKNHKNEKKDDKKGRQKPKSTKDS